MADIFDVAEFFIQIANQSDDKMTNLKLNKLLYYSQGAYLTRTGKPLFSGPIEAWTLGPVIPVVYHRYKVCGCNPISAYEENIDCSPFTEEELEVLLDVMRQFGEYTDSKLVSLIRQPNTPWSHAIAKRIKQLSLSDMREYFRKNPVPRFQEKITIPKVDILPADWYNPEEDAEWEAYL